MWNSDTLTGLEPGIMDSTPRPPTAHTPRKTIILDMSIIMQLLWYPCNLITITCTAVRKRTITKKVN